MANVGDFKDNVCPTCGKGFTLKRNLTRHLKIHSATKSFTCDVCLKNFSRNEHLTMHRLNHELATLDVVTDPTKDEVELHVPGSLYVCPTCGKGFTLKGNLTRHQRIHDTSKLFTCDVCEKAFSCREHLSDHHRTHELTTPSETYECNICQASFTLKSSRVRHMRIHQRPQHRCLECNESFHGQNNYNRHMRIHQRPQYKCTECDSVFAQHSKLLQHSRVSHVSVPSISARSTGSTSHLSSIRAHRSQSALGVFSTHVFDSLPATQKDLIMFKEELRPHLVAKLEEELIKKEAFKWYAVLKVGLIRTASDGVEDTISPFFRSNCEIELAADTIEDHMDEAWAKIERSFEAFSERGSGWRLDVVNSLEINIAKYQP